MAVDIRRFAIHEECERSKRGDHAMLIALLRSEKPLPVAIREYIASELEKAPRKRFARQTQRDFDVARKDLDLLRMVARAKLFIASEICERAERDGINPLPHDALNGLASPDLGLVYWRHVSDRAALDLLAENGFEYQDEDLANALARSQRDKTLLSRNLKQRHLLTYAI